MGGSIERTTRARFLLPIALGLAAQGTAIAPAAAADPPQASQTQPSPADVARAHYVRGKDAAKAKQWKAALDDLQAAWRIMEHFQIAGTLGWVELELGHHRDAAEHLSYFLRHAEDVAADEMKATSEMLSEARAKVTELSVQTNVAGAHLLIDGEEVRWPEANAGVFVEPGRRNIEARLGERSSGPVVLEARPGQSQLLRLDLPRGEPPSGVLARREGGTPEPPEPPSSNRKPILIAGGVAAGMGIAGGVVFTVLSLQRAADVRSTAGRLPAETNHCVVNAGTDPRCQNIADLQREQNMFGNIALWGFVGGGLTAVGTLVYGLAAPKSGQSGAIKVLPVVASQGGGALITADF